jgi:hypothetical protein
MDAQAAACAIAAPVAGRHGVIQWAIRKLKTSVLPARPERERE